MDEEEEDAPADAVPAEPLSLEEEEGLAALLAAMKQWLRAPHALNDVPLSISNPRVGADGSNGHAPPGLLPACCFFMLLCLLLALLKHRQSSTSPPGACHPPLQAVVARLEVCMRALGLSLAPPPPVDFDSVPLERLLPVRTPRAGVARSQQVGRGWGVPLCCCLWCLCCLWC